MGEIYILPKKGERELPEWAQRHNEAQRKQIDEAQAEADKRAQDNWGYKR